MQVRFLPGALRVPNPSPPSRGLAWWAGAALLVAVSVGVTAATDTRPSFDAYGWLTWGHMTLHGGLDTNAAPSFKPLPYLFTLGYGLLGDAAQLHLWMVTVTAVSLTGPVFAGRLAYRLSGASTDAGGAGRRWAGGAAAVLAAAALLSLHDEFPNGYLHYVLSAQSDPMIVTYVLAAIDCRLAGRERWTFVLLVLAALGRPECWPFLLADAAWLWRARPGMRWAIVAGLAAVALGWFGIPALSSRSWLVAADNAGASGFGPRGDKTLGVLSRFVIQTPWPVAVSAALAVVAGVWRRDRCVLGLAGCVVAWMVVEVAFGLHGWPALGRYMFEPSAVVIVIGAGFVGRMLVGGVGGVADAEVRSGLAAAIGAIGATLAVTILAGTIPLLINQGRDAREDLVAQRTRTIQIKALAIVISRLGGAARIRGCGETLADNDLAIQTLLAYDIGENVNRIGYKLPQSGHPDNPIVVFTPLHDGGWKVRSERQRSPGCRRLRAGPGELGAQRSGRSG
jgi:hypothetical protein